MPANPLNRFFTQTHRYLSYVFFFLVPLPDKFLPLALGLWAGSWLLWRVSHYRQHFPLSPSAKIGVILFILYNLINYLSALWGQWPELATTLMEHRLSMWVLTGVLCFGFPSFIAYQKVVKSFLWGNLLMIIIFVVRLALMYVSDGVSKYQLNLNGFAPFFTDFKHPAYFSLNLILSFVLYLSTIGNFNKKNVLHLLLLYLTFGVMIFISRSRAGLLSYALLSVGLLFYAAAQQFKVRKLLLWALPIFVLLVTAMLSTDKFKLMFDDSEHVSVRAPRKILWKTGVQMVLEKPFGGYGLGSSKAKFVEKCKENGLYLAYEKQFNTHNQYLETALESGLISLLLLLLALFFFAKAVERKRRHIAVVLLLIFGFALFFESMLLRIAALSTFMAMVLMIITLSQNKEADDERPSASPLPIYITFAFLLIILGLRLHSRTLVFDPLRPQTYASKDYVLMPKHNLPEPLPMVLQEKKVAGALYDHRAEASLWSGNAYLLNKLIAKSIKEDQILEFSVFCYVSKEFDGDWVKISIDNDPGKPSLAEDFYDLNTKGVWQKLQLRVEGESGVMPAHFFFARHHCNSLEELQGYVLFAYPQYQITQP